VNSDDFALTSPWLKRKPQPEYSVAKIVEPDCVHQYMTLRRAAGSVCNLQSKPTKNGAPIRFGTKPADL
jgi:hypothetical protein